MARLPDTIRRPAAPNADHWLRRIEHDGARTRATMLFNWRRARDERARQTQKEALRPSAPERDASTPWWAAPWLSDAQDLLLPEPEILKPTINDDDYYEEDLEAEPAAPDTTVAPADAGAITERLRGLNREQIMQVAEAFSRQDDRVDEEKLRQNLIAYVDEWGNDVADETDGDREAAREAGRREAIDFLTQEIDRAVAAPTTAEGEPESD